MCTTGSIMYSAFCSLQETLKLQSYRCQNQILWVVIPAEHLTISPAALNFKQFVTSDLIADVLLLFSPQNLPNTPEFSCHNHLIY